MNFYSYFAYSENNMVKFVTVVFHIVLLSVCEFHENRCSESNTLLNGVNIFFPEF
jgi:hypothetical protein